jgi:hypothetical protein
VKGIGVYGSNTGSVDTSWEILVEPYGNLGGSQATTCVSAFLGGADARVGMILADSGTGKFVFFGLYNDGTGPLKLRVEKFNADGTSAGTLATDETCPFVGANLLQLTCYGDDTGVTLAVGLADGGAIPFAPSLTISGWVTSDRVGFGCTSANPGNLLTLGDFVHWSNA